MNAEQSTEKVIRIDRRLSKYEFEEGFVELQALKYHVSTEGYLKLMRRRDHCSIGGFLSCKRETKWTQ